SLQEHALLRDPAVQADLERLVKLFDQATMLADSEHTKKRFVLRLGTRFLVPGSVLLGALALIVFLLGSIIFATGTVAVTPRGLIVTNPLANAAATATVHAPTHAPTHATTHDATPTPQATATGGGQQATSTPTPRPPPAAPVLAVAPPSITPCFQQPDQ